MPSDAGTILDALVEALGRGAQYNRNDQVAPAVILWTDKDRQWEPLAPVLRQRIPHFLMLGPFAPPEKTGPAIWIKCLLARQLPEANWPAEATPILYLPGVSRQELRAVEDCPQSLQPLAELQYRGVFWSQVNGRDWTILAFLRSKDGGLGLDVAQDQATVVAMARVVAKLSEVRVKELASRRLEAADFDAILTPDLPKQLLTWMNDTSGTRQLLRVDEWGAFCTQCRTQYGFDPQTDGELVGAEKLGRRDGAWANVWDRFAEAPQIYPNLPALLRRAKPDKEGPPLFSQPSSWPQTNEKMETELRGELVTLNAMPTETARQALLKLEQEHSLRRNWVWAKLGQAPLALALAPLAKLASVTRKPLGGATAEAMAESYASEGWQADAAVLDALAIVESTVEVEAVRTAVSAVYRPWLQATAERFQDLTKDLPALGPARAGVTLSSPEPGVCTLFVDGLRFDVGQKLKAAMGEEGWVVNETSRWTALPPVTATAKPAISPITDLLSPQSPGSGDLVPVIAENGKALSHDRFRALLKEREVQYLDRGEAGNPMGMAWTECGDLDHYGHDQQWKLIKRIEEEIRGIIDRIQILFAAGWREIRIVTDHGWLLLPGGLPKTELPAYLVDTKWSRCAFPKAGTQPEHPAMPWYWNDQVWVVMAPGISCFKAGLEYAHGGLSLQECLVPEFVVGKKAPALTATVQKVEWVGLRCRVTVAGTFTGLSADLRTKVADPSSSVADTIKPIGTEGSVSLLVPEDSIVGAAAVLVLVDPEGKVIAKRSTVVGGEE